MYRKIISILTILVSLVLSPSEASTNGIVRVRWTFASKNTDGTPLIDLAGGKVYYGLSSSNYTRIVYVPGGKPGEEGKCTVSNLVVGVTYYLNGTAYNTAGLESDFCNEVVKEASDPKSLEKPIQLRVGCIK